MHRKFKSHVPAVGAAQARQTLREPGRARVDAAVSGVNAASGVNFGPAPTIGELFQAARSQAHVDAAWFKPETLKAMYSDLRERAALTLAARDLGGYDKAVAATEAVRFTIHLLERAAARQQDGAP